MALRQLITGVLEDLVPEQAPPVLESVPPVLEQVSLVLVWAA